MNKKGNNAIQHAVAYAEVVVTFVAIVIGAAVVANYASVASRVSKTMTLPVSDVNLTSAKSPTTAMCVKSEAAPASVTIIENDGEYLVMDPTFVLDCNGESVAVSFPAGEYAVNYDKNAGFVRTTAGDGEVTVCYKTSEGSEAATGRFNSTDGATSVYVAVIPVSETSSVTITIAVPMDKVEESYDTLLQQLAGSVATEDAPMTVILNGTALSVNEGDTVVINESVIGLGNGDGLVAIAPFEQNVADAGFKTEYSVPTGFTLLKGDYVDANTGFTSYIWTTEQGNLKIVAKGDTVISQLFSGAPSVSA